MTHPKLAGAGGRSRARADSRAPDWTGKPRRDLPTALFLALVGAVLALALAFRLWGIQNGLPFSYNIDESTHFVPGAVAFFADLNPHYFENPPAFTYVLYVVYAIWFGGRLAASEAFAIDPTALFTVGRVTVAVLGTLAVGLCAALGARLFDRRVGVLAGALMAVAFVPVFYSHLALNDVPLIVPLIVSLYGSAGLLSRRAWRDWAYAGAGLGFAAATKYTAGIVALPLVIAIALLLIDARPWSRRAAIAGAALASLLAVGAFILGNPWSVLEHSEWREGVAAQEAASDSTKLGLPTESGIVYYLKSLTWSLGWVPAIGALLGVVVAFRVDWRRALVLVVYAVVFILYMGTFERFFGRWLMPAFPALCVLAALAVVFSADWFRSRRPLLGKLALGVGAAALVVQGIVLSVHGDLALSRSDTRGIAREWMVRHIPAGTRVVIEPIVPPSWNFDPNGPIPGHPSGRWNKFLISEDLLAAAQRRLGPGSRRIELPAGYEYVLTPDLVDVYRRTGFCWVVIGSDQYGRAFSRPGKAPQAVRYYERLRRESTVRFEVSPYRRGTKAPPFDFDATTTYYPLDLWRTGPSVLVLELKGCAARG